MFATTSRQPKCLDASTMFSHFSPQKLRFSTPFILLLPCILIQDSTSIGMELSEFFKNIIEYNLYSARKNTSDF